MAGQQAAVFDRDGDRMGVAVSVIIPAYNVAQYIGEALDSVFAQTYTDYETIVVNDGSPDTDELERVLAPYAERIVYIKQKNGGLSAARNAAIRAARGRYIALLDPDDVWEPNYLAVQVETMEKDPTLAALYPNAVHFGGSSLDGREYMETSPSEGEVTFERLLMQQCNVLVNVLARRDAVVGAGMFDESLRRCEDFDLWLRLVHRGERIAYHRAVLVRRRVWPGSLSADNVAMLKSVLTVIRKAERTMSLTTADRKALRRARARFKAELRLVQGRKALFRGDARTALDCLTEANTFFRRRKITLAVWLMRLAPQLLRRALIATGRHHAE